MLPLIKFDEVVAVGDDGTGAKEEKVDRFDHRGCLGSHRSGLELREGGGESN